MTLEITYVFEKGCVVLDFLQYLYKFSLKIFEEETTRSLRNTGSKNSFNISAIKIAGCKSNNECSGTEACVNERCVSPCDCGQNTKCIVSNHYPSCLCLPGYSGNPHFGCTKCKYHNHLLEKVLHFISDKLCKYLIIT